MIDPRRLWLTSDAIRLRKGFSFSHLRDTFGRLRDSFPTIMRPFAPDCFFPLCLSLILGSSCPFTGLCADEKESKAPHSLYEVKAGPFVKKTKLDGTIVGVREFPVVFAPKRWSKLNIVTVAPQASQVKQGDILIQLETEELEKAIEDMKKTLPEEELALNVARQELAKAEESLPIELEQLRRTTAEAADDLDYFTKTRRPLAERDARENLKQTADALSYAEEELKQLKKMYEKDDLTEETEEIILTRAQNDVDAYLWSLEQIKERTNRLLETTFPREAVELAEKVALQKLAEKVDTKLLPDKLAAQRVAVAELERALVKSRESLAEHEEDLAAMTVKAPFDGIVYLGMTQRGGWPTAESLARKVMSGAELGPREIVLTLVDVSRVRLHTSLKEEALRDLAVGKKGIARLKWNADVEIPSTVTSFSPIPFADGTYDAVLELGPTDAVGPVYPPMSATAEITVYEAANVLTIPVSSVKDKHGEKSVTLADGTKRIIKTGRRNEEMIEVLDGLDIGDKIRWKDPEKEDEKEDVVEEENKDNKGEAIPDEKSPLKDSDKKDSDKKDSSEKEKDAA
jgi:HlyD family secretion protein